jgi:hypothetical protein
MGVAKMAVVEVEAGRGDGGRWVDEGTVEFVQTAGVMEQAGAHNSTAAVCNPHGCRIEVASERVVVTKTWDSVKRPGFNRVSFSLEETFEDSAASAPSRC